MGLRKRLYDFLGIDYVVEKEVSYPLYEYDIEFPNGDVTTVRATKHVHDECVTRFYEPDEETWAAITAYKHYPPCKPWSGVSRGYDRVAEIGGIRYLDKEKVGEIFMSLEVDLVSKEVLSVDVERTT